MIFESCFLEFCLFCSCLNRADIIRVYDGRTSSDPSIRMLCNVGNELEVLSTSSELFVEFVANSDWPGQGFKASFQFEPIDDNSVGKYNFHCPLCCVKPFTPLHTILTCACIAQRLKFNLFSVKRISAHLKLLAFEANLSAHNYFPDEVVTEVIKTFRVGGIGFANTIINT